MSSSLVCTSFPNCSLPLHLRRLRQHVLIMTVPEYFGGPPGVSAPNIWRIAEMRSVPAFPACTAAHSVRASWRRDKDDTLSYTFCKTCPFGLGFSNFMEEQFCRGCSGSRRGSATGVAPGRDLRVQRRLLRSRRHRGSQNLYGGEVLSRKGSATKVAPGRDLRLQQRLLRSQRHRGS